MYISVGWFWLLAGVWGAIANAFAKRFYKADFANRDGVIPEEDYTTEVAVGPKMRWSIVGLCVAVAVVGLILIQHDHNWKPFRLDGWVLSGR